MHFVWRIHNKIWPQKISNNSKNNRTTCYYHNTRYKKLEMDWPCMSLEEDNDISKMALRWTLKGKIKQAQPKKLEEDCG